MIKTRFGSFRRAHDSCAHEVFGTASRSARDSRAHAGRGVLVGHEHYGLTVLAFVLATIFSLPLPAMPTREETARAESVVKQLLASERAALASGKKTRAKVADAALKLASEADTEAAKLLLMKGAFVLYVKDGKVEKAARTMNAIEKAIADLPPQSVTNMIDLALLGLPKKDGERLYQCLAVKKTCAKGRTTIQDDRGAEMRNAERIRAGEVSTNARLSGRGSLLARRDGVKESAQRQEKINGYIWSYRVVNGEATIIDVDGSVPGAVSSRASGDITIPDVLDGVKVTSIGQSAFSHCTGLASVSLPPTLTSIGKSSFYGCGSLRSVKIPPSVTNIDSLAFYNSGLSSVTIPEGVIHVGFSSFGDCWGLKSIVVPASLTSLGDRAFSSGKSLESIVVSPKNPKFASVEGVLYSKDIKTLIAGVGGDVTVCDGVTQIADNAFYKCGLTSVAIPASVTKIGESVFHWCDSVMSFIVSPENQSYASIDGLLCSKDGKILIAGVNGRLAIPDGVETIAGLAFSSRRQLTTVILPASLKRIEDEAFRCCSGLNSVTVLGNPPSCGKNVFSYCNDRFLIHVRESAKSWAGMKAWQGIPLVRDVKVDAPASIPAAKPTSTKNRTSIQSIIDGMIKVPGRDFWLSETELTQGQWEAIMGNNRSRHKGANLPVECVSRDDCDGFLAKLNQTKEVQKSRFEFYLPTLPEWMYAAQAGGSGTDCWIKRGVVGKVLDIAWVKENSGGETHAVATKAPNAFGFYDMLGNVWEWMYGEDLKMGCRHGFAFDDAAAECSVLKGWHKPRNMRFDHSGLRVAARVRPAGGGETCADEF